ncbi:hypothetical protein D3C86_1157740 [compost metagenome]
MEDGQRDGRPKARRARRGAQQVARAQGLEAGERGQVDVGVELRFGGVDGAARGLSAPARGHDVGAMAQQIQRNGRGHDARGRGQVHGNQRLAALRAGACQRRDLIAQLRQRCFRLRQFHLAGRQRRFRLLHFHLRIQAGAVAALRQGQDIGALRDHPLEHIALREGVLQVQVGAYGGAGQHVARGLRVGGGGLALRHGRLQA